MLGDEKKAHRYDGRWWEVQANRAMSGLLCPRPLVREAMKPFLSAAGLLGVEILASLASLGDLTTGTFRCRPISSAISRTGRPSSAVRFA